MALRPECECLDRTEGRLQITVHLLRSDLEPGTADCPRGCSHDEPECALDTWVAAGSAGPAGADRLESLRRLLRARTKD